MATTFYLLTVVLLVPAGALLGYACHIIRANFSAHPEKILEERGFLSSLANDMMSKESLIADGLLGGEWNSMGYWEADSLRNILLYVVPGAVMPLLLGIFFFPQHAEIVDSTCLAMRSLGLDPPLCPVVE